MEIRNQDVDTEKMLNTLYGNKYRIPRTTKSCKTMGLSILVRAQGARFQDHAGHSKYGCLRFRLFKAGLQAEKHSRKYKVIHDVGLARETSRG